MLLWLIIACEIGFWVMLFSGLLVRYYLKNDRMSMYILLSVPILDVILLCATFIDLMGGATATFAHGLAAAYLGFTVVFAKSVIAWADNKMSIKFNNVRLRADTNLSGWSYALYEWKCWAQGVIACSIAALILFLGITIVGQPSRTETLTDWYYILLYLMLIWAVFGPIWYSIFWKKGVER